MSKTQRCGHACVKKSEVQDAVAKGESGPWVLALVFYSIQSRLQELPGLLD